MTRTQPQHPSDFGYAELAFFAAFVSAFFLPFAGKSGMTLLGVIVLLFVVGCRMLVSEERARNGS